jgi:hypothetical protein
VAPAIEAMGYRYLPYRFSLDEQRVYDLLMGKNLYRNRLDAVRELIQNAVDACKLRDNLMQSYDQTVTPAKVGRIKIIYEEPIKDDQAVRLTVADKGWHTFVSDNMNWPVFAEYLYPITGCLYDSYSGNNFLNKTFEKHFDGFEIREIDSVPSLIDKLVSARSGHRLVQFERAEIDLLMRLSAAAGDLRVRRFGAFHTVRDLITGRGQSLEELGPAIG